MSGKGNRLTKGGKGWFDKLTMSGTENRLNMSGKGNRITMSGTGR